MNDAPVSALPRLIAPNRWNALGGIWRLTFRKFLQPTHGLALAGMLVVLIVISIPSWPHKNSPPGEYLSWLVNFYLLFLTPVLSFITAGGVMRDEMKGQTVDYVFTRPVRRPWFLLCKYASHVACSQIDFLIALLVMLTVGTLRQAPEMWAQFPLLLLGQVLAIAVFSAFGFLCAVVTSRYVIVGLIYGSAIELGLGQIPTQLSRLSMTHHLRVMLEPALSPLAAFSGSTVATTVGVLVVVSALLLALAAGIFSRLELSGPGEA
jgi:ABC-2 type transport system permease protein